MSRIIPFILIVVAIGLFVVYTRPTWEGDVATTRAQIDSYNSALDASTSFQQKEAALETARNMISQDDLTRLEAFLPDSVDNIQLILDLNALAARSGIALSNFATASAPDAPTTPATPGTDTSAPVTSLGAQTPLTDSLTLSVDATGSYSAFRTFLTGIETSLRPLDVEEVSITDSDTGVYTYLITLKFYWLH